MQKNSKKLVDYLFSLFKMPAVDLFLLPALPEFVSKTEKLPKIKPLIRA